MKMQVDDITLIKRLGKGSFGEVFLSSKIGYRELFATKRIERKLADAPNVKKYFHNEIAILKELNHKNIMKLIEFKETASHYYLVCELCNGGSLTECLDKYRKIHRTNFPENIVQYLMKQIVDAIKYLHSLRIIHRDLKLDNILVSFDSDSDKSNVNMMKAKIKIIDFGFATHINAANLAFSTLGSPINMDPLILKKLNKKGGNIGYDEKVDIWSLGTVCYEMLIGKSTFDAVDMKDLVNKVEKGTYTIPSNLSREAVSFLNAMLQYDGKMRLSAEELSRHHFLVKNFKDFTPIDLTKLKGNLDRNGDLKVNVHKNKSIWDFCNDDIRASLAEVPGYCLMEEKNDILETIPENENFIMDNKGNNANNRINYVIPTNIARYNNVQMNHGGHGQFFNAAKAKQNVGAYQAQNYTNFTNNVPTNMGYNNQGNVGYTGFQQPGANNMMASPQGNAANDQLIKNEIIKAFDIMNDDFLYIEPLFIPLIPGNDPTVINPQDEYNDDENF